MGKKVDIQELRKSINSAKTELSVLKGRKKELMESLSKDFDCNSLKAAHKLVESIKKEINKLKVQKDNMIEDLNKDIL